MKKNKKKILQKIKVGSLKQKSKSFARLCAPLEKIKVKEEKSKSNLRVKLEFKEQLRILLYFHLEDFKSGRDLLQRLKSEEFAKAVIVPEKEIKKSTFFEAINHRGLSELEMIFSELSSMAVSDLPTEYSELGELVSVDGSLIEALFSMKWADYRKKSKKAKMHLGFDVNHKIPRGIALTNGKADEKNYVSKIVKQNQTAILDRYYHSHDDFDRWQDEGIDFVCRIKANTIKTVYEQYSTREDSIVFYDALVFLGAQNQTQKPLRLIAYRVGGSVYWIATNRFDLTAEQIAFVYKLRWDVESFFAWFKQHLKVYPIIAQSKYGLTVQILSGLIFFLLFSLYCMQSFQERVSVYRLRELRILVRNEFLFSLFLFIEDPPLDKPQQKVRFSYII